MGIRSVSLDQCDLNNMVSEVKVTFDKQLELHKNDPDLQSEDDLEREIDLEEKYENKLNVTDLGIRKRKVGGTHSKEVEEIESDDLVSHIEDINLSKDKNSLDQTELTEKRKPTKPADPIKWFGVLVPPALRQSQAEFKKSVQMSVTVANLKIKLCDLQTKYKTLLKEKQNSI